MMWGDVEPVTEPKHIPWTIETCPVGGVVKFCGSNPSLIVEAVDSGCFIGRGGYWSFIEIVRNEKVTHNGKPCGTEVQS